MSTPSIEAPSARPGGGRGAAWALGFGILFLVIAIAGYFGRLIGLPFGFHAAASWAVRCTMRARTPKVRALSSARPGSSTSPVWHRRSPGPKCGDGSRLGLRSLGPEAGGMANSCTDAQIGPAFARAKRWFEAKSLVKGAPGRGRTCDHRIRRSRSTVHRFLLESLPCSRSSLRCSSGAVLDRCSCHVGVTAAGLPRWLVRPRWPRVRGRRAG